jgi:TrmH family RNA methyltransferase
MITSTKNPRIVQARKLSQRKHRLRQNCFLVEGLQLLSLAVQTMATSSTARAKIKPREIFYSETLFTGETAPRLLRQLSEAAGEVHPVAPNVLDSLSQRDTAQGLVASFALRELEWPIDELVSLSSPPSSPSPPNLILILDQLQDPGNLGTLIRTADAVGARAVILLEPGVDPFDPKTVRATMGSIFTVPFSRTKNIEDILPRLSKLGYHLVGADANRGVEVWQSNVLAGPVALVLGNEARGLSPELHPHLAGYVSLPLRGQAESLNVSVAGGVLMYEWLRLNGN